MDYMKDYIKALRENKSYDWITNYGHNLSKYELIDIIKELDYAIYYQLCESDRKYIYTAAAEELEALYEDEEE